MAKKAVKEKSPKAISSFLIGVLRGIPRKNSLFYTSLDRFPRYFTSFVDERLGRGDVSEVLLASEGDIVEPKDLEQEPEVTKRGSRRTIIRDATQMLSRWGPKLP